MPTYEYKIIRVSGNVVWTVADSQQSSVEALRGRLKRYLVTFPDAKLTVYRRELIPVGWESIPLEMFMEEK